MVQPTILLTPSKSAIPATGGVLEVLVRVQGFDPAGVAARTLQECLLLQARHVGADDELVLGIITKHLHNLEKRNYAAIAKDLNVPQAWVAKIREENFGSVASNPEIAAHLDDVEKMLADGRAALANIQQIVKAFTDRLEMLERKQTELRKAVKA